MLMTMYAQGDLWALKYSSASLVDIWDASVVLVLVLSAVDKMYGLRILGCI